MCQAYLHQDTDHVVAFVEQHTRPLKDLVCYIPVEYLKVTNETEVMGIRLLSTTDSRVPPPRWKFRLEPPIASALAIPVQGTDYARMAERARAIGRHALRRLRIALREHFGINNRQLRFRLGEAYSFGEDFSGWASSPDVAYELEINKELVDLAESQPVAQLPMQARNDVEAKALLALRWMETAWFASEPLTALLYLFFALEALLGDKSEGLKAPGLAFRQAILSAAVTGGFTHPNKTYFLYDRVRSGAVHGEDAPEINWDIVHDFATTVRWTMSHYLRFARDRGITRRGQLLKALDEHPEKPNLIAWLYANGGPEWEKYLASASPPEGNVAPATSGPAG